MADDGYFNVNEIAWQNFPEKISSKLILQHSNIIFLKNLEISLFLRQEGRFT